MSGTGPIRILDGQVPKEKRSFPQKLLIAIVVLCGVPFLLAGIWALSLLTLNSEQNVSGQMTLTPEWVSITPPKPLRPAKQSQEIVLDVDPAEGLVRDNSNLKQIRLASGTVVRPEVQIVDQHGNVFTADWVVRYPTPSRYEHGVSVQFNEPDLPQDRDYTEVRVKSDKPLKLFRIVWHCHTGM